jgi:organic radical activating enzyme
LEQARKYAEQLPSLKENGVERVSFTGGEPFLAIEQLELLSKAAVDAGIECTIVTACHWAKTNEGTKETILRLKHIRNWHLSTDLFHEVFLPVEYVLRAANVALALGRRVIIRIAVTMPLVSEDLRFFERLEKIVSEEIEIAIQPVSRVGRAENLDIHVSTGRRRGVPCMSTGFVVRYDGTVSPCCSSLVDKREGHPFQYERVTEVGLVKTYEAWQADPVLQLIRAVGFEPVLNWVKEDFPDHPVLKSVPDHPCDICIGLWRKPGTAEMLRHRCNSDFVRNKVVDLYQTVFDSPDLEEGRKMKIQLEEKA